MILSVGSLFWSQGKLSYYYILNSLKFKGFFNIKSGKKVILRSRRIYFIMWFFVMDESFRGMPSFITFLTSVGKKILSYLRNFEANVTNFSF